MIYKTFIYIKFETFIKHNINIKFKFSTLIHENNKNISADTDMYTFYRFSV